jgi:hypothetical protein
MVASISNSLIGSDAAQVGLKSDSDSDKASNSPLAPKARDRGPDVIKNISPQGALALQLLGGSASLFKSSSVFQSGSADTRSKPFIGQQLIDTLARKGASEDVIKSLTEQAKKDQQTIDSANALKGNFAQQKKGNASQKLEALRQQLKALKQFGGDPKVIARIAAEIAHEIAAAAQEYGDAGQLPVDASAGIATNAGAASGADQASSQNEANAQAATGEQAGAEAGAVNSAGDANASTSSDAETDTSNKSDVVGSAGDPETVSAGDAKDPKDAKNAKEKYEAAGEPSSPDGRVSGAREKALAALIHKSIKSDGDREFAQEVRELLAEAKSILQRALKRAKEEKSNQTELDQIQKKFSDAAREAEHSIDSILNGKESLFASAGVSGGGEAGGDVDVASIQAEAQIQVAARSVNIVV